MPGVLPVPTGKSKPPSTTAKERNDLPMVGPPNRLGRTPTTVDAGQQILPHRDLRIHKMDRVPPSSQRYSRNNSLSVIEPYLLKIRTAFKGQLWPRNPLHRWNYARRMETPGHTGQTPHKPYPISSGQVERANRTVVSMLKKYVATNQKDWDIKLLWYWWPLEPHPINLPEYPRSQWWQGETWRYHYNLLYQPGDLNLVTAYNTHQYLEELPSAPENNFRLRATAATTKCGRPKSLLRPKGLSPWAQCRRSSVVLQFRPTKAECSPSPVKEVPTSLDGTPWDCRQALTCCLSNQNQTRAQRASPSMGPSKPDKEAHGKGEDQTHWHRPICTTRTICTTQALVLIC